LKWGGKRKSTGKAVSHRDSYAPKRIFSRNTATKNHGRRQPCHDFLFCLAEKPLALECFAVLSGRFLLTGTAAGRGNTGCILRPRLRLWGKRFDQNRMNPYGRPPNSGCFLCALLGNQFHQSNGKDWWTTGVNEKIRDKANSRKASETKVKWRVNRGDAMMSYLDFGDLPKTICTRQCKP
jgi:hypothetical protein